MIDNLFNDCDKIAEKYKCDVSDVITQFTLIEMSFRNNKLDFNYKDLLERTHDYFKNIYGDIKDEVSDV